MWILHAQLIIWEENRRRCGYGHLLRKDLCGQSVSTVDWLGQLRISVEFFDLEVASWAGDSVNQGSRHMSPSDFVSSELMDTLHMSRVLDLVPRCH